MQAWQITLQGPGNVSYVQVQVGNISLSIIPLEVKARLAIP